MNRQLIQGLSDEIQARSEELDLLIEARDLLVNGAVATRALPAKAEKERAPRKKGRRKAGKPRKAAKARRARKSARRAVVDIEPGQEPDGFGATINNKFIPLCERHSLIFDKLAAAPEGETVTVDALAEIYDGNVAAARQAVNQMKGKFKPAQATIGNVRGQGYRLEQLS